MDVWILQRSDDSSVKSTSGSIIGVGQQGLQITGMVGFVWIVTRE
jgi:hypothetical protein